MTFRSTPHHHLDSLLDREDECPASTLKILGFPLIIRNLLSLRKIFNIDTICIPNHFSTASRLIQDNFPALNLKEFCDDVPNRTTNNISTASDFLNHAHNGNCQINIPIQDNTDSLEIPINSLIHNSSSSSTGYDYLNNPNNDNILHFDIIAYPWQFLNAVQSVLNNEITHTVISPMATVAKSSIINGPCIIEDNVTIDDFCKIVGPTYIGADSFIGMSSLIRKSMMGVNTRIGFNCEVGKTYFEGHARISHQNVILDSIIGRNVWFGGYSGTANVLLDRKNVRYQIDHKLIDTGTDHFGAVVGNNCAIGASVIVLPGRQIPSNTVIQAGTVVGKEKIDCIPKCSTVNQTACQ